MRARFGVLIALLSGTLAAGCGAVQKDGRAVSVRAAGERELSIGALESALQVGGTAGPVVVRVGREKVTRATVEYWMRVGVPYRAVPDAPRFGRCIAQARARHAGRVSRRLSDAELKSQCAKRYRYLRDQATEFVISTAWLLGEARSLGITVDDRAVQQEYRASEDRFFPTPAKRREYFATTGRTRSDIFLELRAGQLSDRIYKRIAASEGPLTDAAVADYYSRHVKQFAVPERRDLGIVRTSTLRAALAAKKRLASGAGFAEVVHNIHLIQPYLSKDGQVKGLTPRLYSEPPLNNAIFSARPHVLSGPVRISLGYYVFEVDKIEPAYQRSLAQSEPAIRAKLPEELHRKTLANFVADYKTGWKAATRCAPGYVVRKCKEYGGDSQPEDPYTF